MLVLVLGIQIPFHLLCSLEKSKTRDIMTSFIDYFIVPDKFDMGHPMSQSIEK